MCLYMSASYAHIHTHIIYSYTYPVSLSICVYATYCIYRHACMHTHIHYAYIRTYTSTCMYIQKHIHTKLLICIYARMYIYISIQFVYMSVHSRFVLRAMDQNQLVLCSVLHCMLRCCTHLFGWSLWSPNTYTRNPKPQNLNSNPEPETASPRKVWTLLRRYSNSNTTH